MQFAGILTQAAGSKDKQKEKSTIHIMKTKGILLALALGASTCLLTAQDSNQTSNPQPPPAGESGPGEPGKPHGFHLLPPHAQEQLNLTDDQKKQIADLEAEVKAKIEKILTPEQLEQLKQMRPPHPPGPPPGNEGQAGPQSGSSSTKP